MTAAEFKKKIEGKIPANYIYISRNLYSVKGIPIYLIYFNSRIPNVKISKDSVQKQHITKIKSLIGKEVIDNGFSHPLLLEEYSKEIRTNSLVIFTDLAGSYMSKTNLL